MPRRKEKKHPPKQLLSSVRTAFLSTIRAKCPQVLDDLWDEVFAPLAARRPPAETVALLTRRYPRPDDLPRGSVHREVRASIARWARRWHVNAPWMRDQAWRTVRFWAAYPGSVGGRPPRWAPLIDTRAASRRPTDHKVRRPRDGTTLVWLVRLRVCRPPVPIAQLAAAGIEPHHHVTADTVRVAVNRLAKTLDLPVRRRGRPLTTR